jgi:hypothetical protein
MSEAASKLELTFRASTLLELDLRDRRRLVSAARSFLAELYQGLLDDPDDTFRVVMTAHELLENLVKYSTTASSRVEVGLHHSQQGGVVRVRTRNCATPERLQELCRTLDRITNAQDPLAIYDAFIMESSCREGSGLGLARVRAEADMQLKYWVQGDEVTIEAQGAVRVGRRNTC